LRDRAATQEFDYQGKMSKNVCLTGMATIRQQYRIVAIPEEPPLLMRMAIAQISAGIARLQKTTLIGKV